MKKVQGVSFSVKFTRRGVWTKPPSRDEATDMPVQDNVYARIQPQPQDMDTMGDIPVQTSVKSEIHPHQEHTAPRDTIRAAPQRTSTTQTNRKEMALWHAAKNGDCYAIRLLVMDGVDLDARDSLGRTALNIATQFSQNDAIKTLLAAKEMRRMSMLGELPHGAFFDKFKKVKTVNE